MSRKQRNRCQYCRLLKCLQMGMNRKGELVLRAHCLPLIPSLTCNYYTFQEFLTMYCILHKLSRNDRNLIGKA
jgi:hypothetical protein